MHVLLTAWSSGTPLQPPAEDEGLMPEIESHLVARRGRTLAESSLDRKYNGSLASSLRPLNYMLSVKCSHKVKKKRKKKKKCI